MKKTLSLLLALCLLALPLLSFAEETAPERTVVTALASEVNPDALTSVSVNARIIGYDAKKNTLTLEIIVPERFLPEDIQALKSGDAIWTGGQEIEVQTVADVDGYTVINEGEYEYSEGSVWLYEGLDMNYWVANVHDNVWILLATVDAPVTDHLLFLDEIDPATGDTLVHPTVHSGAEFLAMLEKEAAGEGGPGFDTNNVSVVFDDAGDLALITRYYVPWQ